MSLQNIPGTILYHLLCNPFTLRGLRTQIDLADKAVVVSDSIRYKDTYRSWAL